MLQKLINEVQKKTKQNRKKTKGALHAEKHRMCTQKIRKSKYTQKIKELQNTRIHSSLLDKWNVAKVYSWNFFSCRRCFLSFHLKVKVVESLISSVIEDHTFGPINLREHFPEEEINCTMSAFIPRRRSGIPNISLSMYPSALRQMNMYS